MNYFVEFIVVLVGLVVFIFKNGFVGFFFCQEFGGMNLVIFEGCFVFFED